MSAIFVPFDQIFGYLIVFLAGCLSAFGTSNLALRPVYLVLLGMVLSIAGFCMILFMGILPSLQPIFQYVPGPNPISTQIILMLGFFLFPIGIRLFARGVASMTRKQTT
jgi:uncharacterized membrane protein